MVNEVAIFIDVAVEIAHLVKQNFTKYEVLVIKLL